MIHRRLTIILLLIFTALAAGSVWLASHLESLDASSLLQNQLTKTFQQSVIIGKVKFTASQGLAFEVRDVVIGSLEENGRQLEIPVLWAKLRFSPLLRGRISFAELSCQGPSLVLDLRKKGEEKRRKSLNGSLQDWDNPFQKVVLSRGILKIIDSSGSRLTSPLILKNIQGLFHFRDHGASKTFSLSGQLLQDDHLCPIALQGELSATTASRSWQKQTLQLQATIDDFLPALLLDKSSFAAGWNATGRMHWRFEACGVPSQGVTIRTILNGENLELKPKGYGQKKIALAKAELETRWIHAPQENDFEAIFVKINDLALKGQVRFVQQEEILRLIAEFSTPVFSIAQLDIFLPPALAIAKEKELSALVPAGDIKIDALTYDGPLQLHFPMLSAQISLANAEIHLAGQKIENFNLEAGLFDNELYLKKGQCSFRNIPISFQGSVKKPFEQHREVRLEVEGSPSAAMLLDPGGLANTSSEKVVLTGHVPLSLLAEGRGDKLSLHLKGDLTALSASAGGVVLKKTSETGHLEATATTDFNTWNLDKAQLETGAIQLHAVGNGHLDKDQKFNFQISLVDLDLTKIPRDGKFLKHLRPRGHISFVQNWQGEKGQIIHSRGELQLQNAGFHLTSVLADLNSINGSIEFYRGRAAFKHIVARLGSSPVMISGTLPDVTDPELRLQVKSPRIRADELIFSSPESYLYDLDGSLIISKNQLRFEEVHTRLLQGTTARVKGHVTFSSTPETRLFITSKNAVIDEVIALWQGKSDKFDGERKKQTKLLIDVEAEKGTLENIPFQQAQGRIHFKDNTLVIHPLDFRSGPGYGTGQVLVVKTPGSDQPALLKISGHLENFDAEALSHGLVRFGGLVTGTLRGDFYLEGRTGDAFLPTSRGEFNVEIHNGVLKKFHGLAKVFSLLNVSQIFTLKLPEMTAEGMPFKQAIGTVQMRRGTLSSENVQVNSESMNLSLVGNINLIEKKTDIVLVVKPFGTVDKIVTRIPLAGWILAGEGKALVTAHFEIKGNTADPDVRAIPMTAISRKAQGIFKRILNLPEKMVSETEEFFRDSKTP